MPPRSLAGHTRLLANGQPYALLKDKAKLTAVLPYHVVSGKVKTAQGSEITVATGGGVTVDGAKVSATDSVASNGVIHVIDSVILPK